MSYEDALKGLSEGTARVVEQLWAAVESGQITRTDFPAIAADLIGIARIRGAAAAETAFRGYLEAATGVPVAVSTGASLADRDRLVKAIDVVLASELDTAMQLIRLATNEPLDAAATAYGDALGRSRLVSGWRRGVEAGACQLCVWWAREGRVFARSHRMPRHTGCACHQIPVVDQMTDNYQTAAQTADAARKLARRTH